MFFERFQCKLIIKVLQKTYEYELSLMIEIEKFWILKIDEILEIRIFLSSKILNIEKFKKKIENFEKLRNSRN